MPGLASLFSLAAYLAVVLLAACCLPAVAGVPVDNGAMISKSQLRSAAAACAFLSGFMFIPPGSLSPFVNTPWGGAAMLVCLFIGSALCGRFMIFPVSIFCVVFAVLAWYAWQRGIPGSVGNLGTFVAMPVWHIATGADTVGFLFLATGVLLAAGRFAPPLGSGHFAHSLASLAVSALFVTFFLPWNAAPFVAWPGKFAAGSDFILFWTKCGAVMFCSSRASAVPHTLAASTACCAVGTAGLVFFNF